MIDMSCRPLFIVASFVTNVYVALISDSEVKSSVVVHYSSWLLL